MNAPEIRERLALMRRTFAGTSEYAALRVRLIDVEAAEAAAGLEVAPAPPQLASVLVPRPAPSPPSALSRCAPRPITGGGFHLLG